MAEPIVRPLPWDAWQTWVAIIALIQPWAIGFWRRMFRQGNIDIHETGAIEIGYSLFGSTIQVQGTLRSVHRDLFVRRISLDLIRESDRAHHRFEWVAFGPPRMVLGQQDMTYEQPSGFMLLTVQPHRYNIAFYDSGLWIQITSRIQRVTQAWSDAEAAGRGYEDDFEGDPIHSEAWAALDRHCYWEQGAYRLRMVVETSRPNRRIEVPWRFVLTQQDADRLRLNAVSMLRDACGQSSHYNTALAAYQQGAVGSTDQTGSTGGVG